MEIRRKKTKGWNENKRIDKTLWNLIFITK